MPASARLLTLALTAAATASLTLAGCTSTPSTPQAAASGGAPDEAQRPEPEWDTSPDSVAAIGDSITRAYDACALLAECPEASWATGTDAEVRSLAERLLGEGGDVSGRAWNLAETGATVADLPGQARRAVEHEPELVTVLIGANDACADDVAAMTSVADFRTHFTETMDVIREALPEAGVYVSSVPDLMRLWAEGSESLMARAVWSMAGICPSMLADSGDDSASAAERREAVRERVEEYNVVLEEVCAADDLCRYDGGAVFDYEFTSHHLSDWDWFHPSREGQSELAALAYDAITAR
jgi:lysophospholipase L1-like esterase